MPQRRLMGTQRRMRDTTYRSLVSEVLIDQRRRPTPRILVDRLQEPPNEADPLINRRDLQIPRQLLIPPPCEHLLDRLLLRMQQPSRPDQSHSAHLVNGHETLRNQLHQMHQWCTRCTSVTISAGQSVTLSGIRRPPPSEHHPTAPTPGLSPQVRAPDRHRRRWLRGESLFHLMQYAVYNLT